MPDPGVGFHYVVDIGGKVTGYFTECSGLGSEHEIIEHKVIDDKGKPFIEKVPGRMKWQDITLKRGITDNTQIWEWRKLVEDGKVEQARTNGSITMVDQELKPIGRWNFERAWPTKVSGPALKSDSNEIGIEELVITHERLERV